MISNLEDFDENSSEFSIFPILVKLIFMINYNKVFEEKVRSLYHSYEFHTLVNYIKTYCSEQLGSFYLDIVKTDFTQKKVIVKFESHVRSH